MTVSLKDIVARTGVLLNSGSTLDGAARKLNVEFHACAYANRGKLWCSYKDESGNQKLRVIA